MKTHRTGELLANAASAADVEAAREWLKDCGEWANMEESDFDDLNAEQVLRGVNRYYFGGLAQFYRDGVHVMDYSELDEKGIKSIRGVGVYK